MPTETIESYWEDASLPRDSLSRAAERLKSRGSLYLGGGVGVEVKQDGKYNVIGGGTHDGPLSAVTKALTLAGQKKLVGTPGDRTVISDPAIAARIFELDGEKAEVEATIQRMERSLARRAQREMTTYLPTSSMAVDDKTWEQRRIDESKVRLRQIKEERERLLSGKVSEGVVDRNGMVHSARDGKFVRGGGGGRVSDNPRMPKNEPQSKFTSEERAELDKLETRLRDLTQTSLFGRPNKRVDAEMADLEAKIRAIRMKGVKEAESREGARDETPFWVPA